MKASRIGVSSGLVAMRALGAGVDGAQRVELGRGRRRRRGDLVRITDLPAGVGVDLLAGDARMDRHHGHFLADTIGLEHAQVGDEPGRPFGRDAEARPMIAALAVAERGYEFDLVAEAAPAVCHGDEYLAAR